MPCAVHVLQVDALQGQEADICVVTTVRAPQLAAGGHGRGGHGLGFLDDNRRTNVMLSRSQQLLVIVGDAGAWLRGPPGSLLRAFAAKSLAEGSCFDASEEPGVAAGDATSGLVAVPVEEGSAPGLVRLGLARETPGELEAIWRAPLPDFVPPSSTRARPSKSASKRFKPPAAQKSFPISRASRLIQPARGSNGGGAGAGGTNGGGVAGSSGVGCESPAPVPPTQAALVAAVKLLSVQLGRKLVPGITLMKHFSKAWRNTAQAKRAFESAGMRLIWHGSHFFVVLPR